MSCGISWYSCVIQATACLWFQCSGVRCQQINGGRLKTASGPKYESKLDKVHHLSVFYHLYSET